MDNISTEKDFTRYLRKDTSDSVNILNELKEEDMKLEEEINK